jgi:Mannose-6-phosphate isomerase
LIITSIRQKISALAEPRAFLRLGRSGHCLKNPGAGILELIEVQSGDYLDEEDIVRYEDVYGRSAHQRKWPQLRPPGLAFEYYRLAHRKFAR